MNSSTLNPQPSPLIVIVGETASGKSALAMEVAGRLNGEIIGADSWTVYREFNIGTAKPSAEELARVPHHLFDIVDAPDGFNAALFKKLATAAIADIHSRGKVPILVGGTGLYIDSVIFDYEFMPPGDPAERERRNAMNIEDVLAEAEAEGVSLGGVDIRNKRRIIRALETNGMQPGSTELRENTLVLGVAVPREELRERVIKRVDSMLDAGLEMEVKILANKYGWDVEPMKGIGYREWREYFSGSQTLTSTRERIISSTMKLAKRQRTWFKRNNSIQWVNNRYKIVDIATTLLNKND
jgi:tRNA dimethylallyltransferase